MFNVKSCRTFKKSLLLYIFMHFVLYMFKITIVYFINHVNYIIPLVVTLLQKNYFCKQLVIITLLSLTIQFLIVLMLLIVICVSIQI